MTIKQNKDLLELEVNGQVGATGAVGRQDREGGNGGREEAGEAGQLGERGLVEVKNSWTLWCWRTWQGSAVRHLGAGRQTGQQGDRQGVRKTQGSQRKSAGFKNYKNKCFEVGFKNSTSHLAASPRSS